MMEYSKGSGRDVKTYKKVVPFTTGYAVLPWDGGIMDQPYRMMEFFEIFMRSERNYMYANLTK
jgi:hypothetical protein